MAFGPTLSYGSSGDGASNMLLSPVGGLMSNMVAGVASCLMVLLVVGGGIDGAGLERIKLYFIGRWPRRPRDAPLGLLLLEDLLEVALAVVNGTEDLARAGGGVHASESARD